MTPDQITEFIRRLRKYAENPLTMYDGISICNETASALESAQQRLAELKAINRDLGRDFNAASREWKAMQKQMQQRLIELEAENTHLRLIVENLRKPAQIFTTGEHIEEAAP